MMDVLKTDLLGSTTFENDYGLISKKVMTCREIPSNAKTLYAYFCSLAGNENTVFPSKNKIRYDLCWGEKKLAEALSMAEGLGLIKKEQKRTVDGKFSHNIYTLVFKIEDIEIFNKSKDDVTRDKIVKKE